MNIRRYLALICMLGATGATGNVHAQRHLDAHQHGHASVNMVTEGSELVIEMEIPGVDVVGFEHQASTEAEKTAVEKALVLFRDPEKLFVPTQLARCVSKHVHVTLGEEQAHHDESDVKEHDEDNPKHQEHQHHQEDKVQERHSELKGVYEFHCAAPSRLAFVDVRLFEYLPALGDVEVQVATATFQTQLELVPGKLRVPLAR